MDIKQELNKLVEMINRFGHAKASTLCYQIIAALEQSQPVYQVLRGAGESASYYECEKHVYERCNQAERRILWTVPQPAPVADRLAAQLSDIEKSVANIAQDIASDYPSIKTINTTEQLYAIAQSFAGMRLAITDLHGEIEILKAQPAQQCSYTHTKLRELNSDAYKIAIDKAGFGIGNGDVAHMNHCIEFARLLIGDDRIIDDSEEVRKRLMDAFAEMFEESSSPAPAQGDKQ